MQHHCIPIIIVTMFQKYVIFTLNKKQGRRKPEIFLEERHKRILNEEQNQSGGKKAQWQRKTDGSRGESYSSRQSSRDAPRPTLAGPGSMTGLWVRRRLIIKMTLYETFGPHSLPSPSPSISVHGVRQATTHLPPKNKLNIPKGHGNLFKGQCRAT